MAHKVSTGRYLCGYCNKEYSDPIRADSCKESHDLVYIALSKSDLNKLLNFIYLRDEELLTESLMRNLTKYLKGNRA